MKKILIALFSFIPLFAFSATPPFVNVEKFPIEYHFKRGWLTDNPEEIIKKIKSNQNTLPSVYELKDYTSSFTSHQKIVNDKIVSLSSYDTLISLAANAIKLPPAYSVTSESENAVYGSVNRSSCLILRVDLAISYPSVGQRPDKFVASNNYLNVKDVYNNPLAPEECNDKNLFSLSLPYSIVYYPDHFEVTIYNEGYGNTVFQHGTNNLIYIPTNIYRKNSDGSMSYLYYFFEINGE